MSHGHTTRAPLSLFRECIRHFFISWSIRELSTNSDIHTHTFTHSSTHRVVSFQMSKEEWVSSVAWSRFSSPSGTPLMPQDQFDGRARLRHQSPHTTYSPEYSPFLFAYLNPWFCFAASLLFTAMNWSNCGYTIIPSLSVYAFCHSSFN